MPRRLRFTKRRKDQFVGMVEDGNTIVSICEAIGIDPSTYRHHRRHDPDFAERVDEAKAFRNTLVEDALYMTALTGNTTAQIFWLCNRSPEEWKSVQHRVHEGAIKFEAGPPIEFIEVPALNGNGTTVQLPAPDENGS